MKFIALFYSYYFFLKLCNLKVVITIFSLFHQISENKIISEQSKRSIKCDTPPSPFIFPIFGHESMIVELHLKTKTKKSFNPGFLHLAEGALILCIIKYSSPFRHDILCIGQIFKIRQGEGTP